MAHYREISNPGQQDNHKKGLKQNCYFASYIKYQFRLIKNFNTKDKIFSKMQKHYMKTICKSEK